MRGGWFWISGLAGIAAAALFGLFVLPWMGLFDMSATGKPGVLDWWGHRNWEASLAWRAPDATLPASADAGEGMEHFAESCIVCHGAPDVRPTEWSQRMQPMPPDLWEEETQEKSDGELFRVVREGVRMTAMPAFGPEHDDADIWNIVAFVRQLGSLTEAQREELRHAAAKWHESHEHGEHSKHTGAEVEGATHEAAPDAQTEPGQSDDSSTNPGGHG